MHYTGNCYLDLCTLFIWDLTFLIDSFVALQICDIIACKTSTVKDTRCTKKTRASKRLRPSEHEVLCTRVTRQLSRQIHEGCDALSQDQVEAHTCHGLFEDQGAHTLDPDASARSSHENQTLHDDAMSDVPATCLGQHKDQTSNDDDGN